MDELHLDGGRRRISVNEWNLNSPTPEGIGNGGERVEEGEKAAGRAADKGPSGVQASCQSEVECPSRGSTLVMERYSEMSDWKHFQAGVATCGWVPR
jgi:hypothetical protein